ncbi:MAG: flagellar export protein FliJ [Oligoflexia bacterium]|nr:flagellar export protein FliJ [Oligoflexia bacterium]
MKRFRFKLETVLKQRKTKEEDALRVLGAAQRAYQEQLNRKAALQAELSTAHRRRESLGIEPVGAVAFKLEDDFIVGTKQRIVHAEQAIFRASKVVARALRAYLEARKATRTLELLREKEYAEYRKARAKWEQKQLDDLTVMRAHLNNSWKNLEVIEVA